MSKNTDTVSLAIINHLKKNPDAGDTLEGIADWWLELERIDTARYEISRILDTLVENGTLRVIETISGVKIYKINRQEHDP
jgi:Fe2+ or Zn2+ uptake regulation protein